MDIQLKWTLIVSTSPQAFNKNFVNLITTWIERVTSKGLKTVDGVEHQADTIIFATGFDLEVVMMMMMMMVVMVMVMMTVTMSRQGKARQARSLIPKKDWKGNLLPTMAMHPQYLDLAGPDIRAFGDNRPDNAQIFVILPGLL